MNVVDKVRICLSTCTGKSSYVDVTTNRANTVNIVVTECCAVCFTTRTLGGLGTSSIGPGVNMRNLNGYVNSSTLKGNGYGVNEISKP